MNSLAQKIEGLTLELQVQKPEVIRGESIRFTITLSNTGAKPRELKDESAFNRAFSIHVTGGWGLDGWADSMSILEREGEHVDQPRTEPRKTLAPGEKMVVRGDVIPWIGDLEVGSYKITGHYQDPPAIRLESQPAEVKVAEAAPVWALSARPNLSMAQAAADTLWLHKSAGAHEIYLLQSSPRNPLVNYANIPLLKVDGSSRVLCSSYNSFPPQLQHLVWIVGVGKLHIARFRSDLPPEPPLQIALEREDLAPIETPYSDAKGNLHLLLANMDGDAAGLVQLFGRSSPVFHAIQASPPICEPRRALWCKDDVLALAWRGEAETEVFASLVQLGSPPRPIAGKKVFEAEHPVVHLDLAQKYVAAQKAWRRTLIVLAREEAHDIFQRWKIDLDDGQAHDDGRFMTEGTGNLRVIQSVQSSESTPLYLLAAPDGAVFYADSSFSRIVPVLDPLRKPVRTGDYPILLAPSSFSTLTDKYVRYIRGGRQFAYFKLPSEPRA